MGWVTLMTLILLKQPKSKIVIIFILLKWMKSKIAKLLFYFLS